MHKSLLIPLLLLFAAGLGFSVLWLSAASGAAPAETVTIQPTATPTRTSMPTATATPTATLEPTATATPTPAPITLPVTNGTPIPGIPYEVITAENVHRLRQIARYGYPRLLETNPYRFTADGKTIVVGTTLGLEFYDTQTQEKTSALEVEFLRNYDLTPDGKYLLTLAGETLTVWKKDGQKVREFNLQSGDAWQLNTAALSPDGALLAVQRKKADWQDADKVDVYRMDGSLVDTVRGNGVLFSPDGQYLATVFDGSLRLYPVAELGQGWEKRLPKQTLPWCGVTEGNCGLVFSPDGTLAALVRAARVEVYRVAERRLIRQVSGWESDGYTLPQVQFADGQMLVTAPVLYDRQGKVQTPAQAIVVDIASGKWMSKSEVDEDFVYLDGGQMRTFRWQAEGEMPMMYHYKISARIDNDNRLDLFVLGESELGFGIVHCTYQNCDFRPFDLPINEIPVYDENLEKYTLQFYPEWNLVHEDKKTHLPYSGHSFAIPNAKIKGDVLIVWAAESPRSSEVVVFEKSTGRVLYRVDGSDFYSWRENVYLFSRDDYAEIVDKKFQKYNFLEGCNGLSRTTIALCTIFGGYYPELGTTMLDFVFMEENFLVANYSDGYIRVWAVVPDGANVR